MKGCILCKSRIKELFSISNMPATAQDIPTKEELEKEKGIAVSLCQCISCGLAQLSSDPVYYYRDVIRAGGYSTTMDRLRRSQYEEFIRIGNLEGKKILEAGCGQGEFLRILADYPVKAYGMEHKHDLVLKARQQGLTVSEGYPEDEQESFEHGPFDAFTSFNFLEHQPKPLMYLRAIAGNLVQDGYGLITVPSFEYILEKKSFYEIIPDHIAYYTRESLRFALESAGFTVVKEERINRDTLSAIVKKKAIQEADVSELLVQKEKIKDAVYALLEKARAGGRKIAVWGASHQGFTLCATTGLAGRVEYIIDSAPFKQGRFAPASHIPIISPLEALLQPAEIILIVAPGYTGEIAKQIRANFPSETEIYTLMDEQIRLLD